MNQAYFLLYAHNVPVRGSKRAAIYNLQAGQVLYIPLVLTNLIEAMRQAPVVEVRASFAPTRPDLFDAYLDFLIRNDLGFYTNNPECFPRLSLDWDTPHPVQTAVIDLNIAHYDPFPVLDQLDALLCRHIEIRLSNGNGTAATLKRLLAATHDRGFRSVSLLLDYAIVLGQPSAWVHRLFDECARIDFILVYNAPFAGKSRTHPEHIQFLEDDLNSAAFREKTAKRRPIVNIPYFTESQQFNPYYNRRVCISQQGQIKNCLLHEQSFGSVLATPLSTAISSETFQALWHAAPDQVAHLRDSELRYCLFLPYALIHDNATGLFTFPPHSPAWSQLDVAPV